MTDVRHDPRENSYHLCDGDYVIRDSRRDALSMSLVETIRTRVCEHHSGMLTNLPFALAWVTVVSALFGVLDEPQWAFYFCTGMNVVVYFGFLASTEATSEKR